MSRSVSLSFNLLKLQLSASTNVFDVSTISQSSQCDFVRGTLVGCAGWLAHCMMAQTPHYHRVQHTYSMVKRLGMQSVQLGISDRKHLQQMSRIGLSFGCSEQDTSVVMKPAWWCPCHRSTMLGSQIQVIFILFILKNTAD